MADNDELKRVLDYALHGVPELKMEEKRKWLGEFRERIVLGFPFEKALHKEALKYVEAALQEPEAEMLIVNNHIPMNIMVLYMQIAKRINKEFKSVSTDSLEAMGVVVASRRAVDRENVTPEIRMLPEEFKNLHHNSLCPEHYEELTELAPNQLDDFKRITLGDRMMGIKCSICQKREDGGPLM